MTPSLVLHHSLQLSRNCTDVRTRTQCEETAAGKVQRYCMCLVLLHYKTDHFSATRKLTSTRDHGRAELRS